METIDLKDMFSYFKSKISIIVLFIVVVAMVDTAAQTMSL